MSLGRSLVYGVSKPAAYRKRERLVVVSNRVGDLTSGSQSGGLAVAVGEALRATGGLWFGWSGAISEDAPLHPPVAAQQGNISVITLDLTTSQYEAYYQGFANGCLWPLFHYRMDLAGMDAASIDGYLQVNERFARELAPLLRPGDHIWVHDYHLIPLASFLRALGVTAPIGFFLHIPFPSPEIFSAIPRHKQLAEALFSYDLIGFQTERDRRNFATYSTDFLKARDVGDNHLFAAGRPLLAEAFPIGIDAAAFARTAKLEQSGPGQKKISQALSGQKLIVGVDRLDYTKGLPQRLEAFEKLLETHDEYHGEVTMVQISPPTRDGVKAYADIRSELEAVAGRVNGRFGDLAWVPVRYLYRSLARRALSCIYRNSRIGLVTPLRDGMNLVAKEYVAAQNPDNPGVLVLSRFAGAAEQLGDALLVNPYDTEAVSEAIHRGLRMGLEERKARHQALLRSVEDEDVDWWRERFLTRLEGRAPESVKTLERTEAA